VDYTFEQKEALETLSQDLQIIACAGSGKTQVISARIVKLLQLPNTGPSNIVAFTFTERAAGELKDRIYRLQRQTMGDETGMAEMFVGTIHGYCLNLLQSEPVYQFLKYGVLSDVQQRLLIDRNSSKTGLTETPLLKGGVLSRWKDSKLYQQLISILQEDDVDRNQIDMGVAGAITKYHQHIDSKRYLDYSRIIAEALVQIEGNIDLQTKLANQIKYLVVDEYQDVNPLQERLIKKLHSLGANLCVVGDDDQTIYQWRGSEVSNIIYFTERYPKVKPVTLASNFRSSDAIVRTAKRIIDKNPERLKKEMQSKHTQSYERGDLLGMKFDTPEQEAEWIADKVEQLLGLEYKDDPKGIKRGLAYSDFAILLRSVKKDASPIVKALERCNIPFIIKGMNELFSTGEVVAMCSVYHFLSGEHSEPTLVAALKHQRLGLNSQQIQDGLDFLKARKILIGDKRNDQLNLQRVFVDFLETIELREENIPDSRGEIVYYNLGKFSQVISDFEQIYFNSEPRALYRDFSGFLVNQAPDYYPEGWLDASYAVPDAVQIMTVHQAKGLQWPVVFVPAMRKNRFPSQRMGGRSVWHIIPDSSVKNADRYRGTVDDERRLFYVALTRAEKFLFCSYAPSDTQKKISEFFNDFTNSDVVLTKEPSSRTYSKLHPTPKKGEINVALTFSELKYYFECPYQFKLKFLYGFNSPIDRAIGYGKSLHDALSEIHSRSIKGEIPTIDDIPRLLDEHLHLPFADSIIEDNLRQGAEKALARYLTEHHENLSRLEHAEKIIELKLADGIVVNGRIDLIRRTDTNEVVIVDFKSNERAQSEEITAKQLQVYALGYEQLTGNRADLIEVHNLEQGGTNREVVDQKVIDVTIQDIVNAGSNLRENKLPRLTEWSDKCARCDVLAVCRKRETKH
jgi:DNA helicase II / ATP-dependent DNA helicase PcrA